MINWLDVLWCSGALQSMASASGESPTDYHHSWGMCATDGMYRHADNHRQSSAKT